MDRSDSQPRETSTATSGFPPSTSGFEFFALGRPDDDKSKKARRAKKRESMKVISEWRNSVNVAMNSSSSASRSHPSTFESKAQSHLKVSKEYVDEHQPSLVEARLPSTAPLQITKKSEATTIRTGGGDDGDERRFQIEDHLHSTTPSTSFGKSTNAGTALGRSRDSRDRDVRTNYPPDFPLDDTPIPIGGTGNEFHSHFSDTISEHPPPALRDEKGYSSKSTIRRIAEECRKRLGGHVRNADEHIVVANKTGYRGRWSRRLKLWGPKPEEGLNSR